MNSRGLIISISGVLVAIIMQVLLSPVITIANAHPNFILIFVVANAVARPATNPVLPFLCGLFYDLIGNGPVGAMALICVVVAYILSYISMTFAAGSFFISIVLIVAGSFIADISYGILLSVCGWDGGLLAIVVERSLPCGLYDAILAAILFPLLVRLSAPVASKAQLV